MCIRDRVDSVCAGDAINLTNTSSAPASATTWSFGDGTTAATTNAVKTYTAPGEFNITLSQTYGACSDSAGKLIKVRPRPKADFSVNKAAFCQAPAAVNFTNNSTNGGSYQWSFGDGSTSNQQSPSHSFTTYGNFTVKLVVTNANGCTDSLSRQIVVNKPTISFGSLPTQG